MKKIQISRLSRPAATRSFARLRKTSAAALRRGRAQGEKPHHATPPQNSAHSRVRARRHRPFSAAIASIPGETSLATVPARRNKKWFTISDKTLTCKIFETTRRRNSALFFSNLSPTSAGVSDHALATLSWRRGQAYYQPSREPAS